MDVSSIACLIALSSQWWMGVFEWSLVELFSLLPVTAHPDLGFEIHLCIYVCGLGKFLLTLEPMILTWTGYFFLGCS